jgi:hypothetical protein
MAKATRTILYYPTINIPSNSWLRHSLLYWDEISSIIPQSGNNKYLHHLSSDIHYLIDEGQFRAMRPEDLISKTSNWEVLQQFQEEFRLIVQSKAFKQFLERKKISSIRKCSLKRL